jgi:tetratricopeptide (TPR) repeat protein
MLMTLSFVVVAGAGFVLTKNLSPSTISESVATSSPEIFAEIDNMEPSKLWRQGKADEAIVEAKKLLQTHSNDAKALMCAGNILCQRPATQAQGLSALHDATLRASESKQVTLYYARKLAELTRYDQAEDPYKDLIRKFDQWTVPKYELATVYIKENQFADAQQQDEEALQHDVENSVRRKELGLLKTINGNAEEGMEEFKDAVNKEHKLGYAGEVEEVMQRNGMDKGKALADASAASANAKDDLSLKLKEVRLMIANNKFDEAKKELAALTEKFPKDPGVPLVIAEMAVWQNPKETTTVTSALASAAKLMNPASEDSSADTAKPADKTK